MSSTTSYARVTFRSRTYLGRRSHEGIGAKNGITLTRVTADGRDDLLVTGAAPVVWEVPWTNVASAVPLTETPAPEPTPEGEPAVRRRGRRP